MTKDFTLEDLSNFVQNENDLLAEVGLCNASNSRPSSEIINSILNYSKSLSVRETKLIGQIEIILN